MAQGTPFDVTKEADTNDGLCGADCSLREAIIAANAAPGDDTVNLPAGHYTLSIAGMFEQMAAMGDLDIVASGKLTIAGVGANLTTIDASGIDRVLEVLLGATAELDGVTVTGGAPGSSDQGGGILSEGTLTITASTVRDNGPSFDGGGIYSGFSSGELTITDSTISGNQATRDGGGTRALGTGLTITNSTISGNSTDDDGGGIQAESGVLLTAKSSTIAFNTAGISGGGIADYEPTQALDDTIVSNNTAPSGPNCIGGAATIGSHNLESGTDCGFTGDLQSAVAGLGALQDNGGPTFTRALPAGSPAIDAGGSACPALDQRGAPRSVCDIGAYDLNTCMGVAVNRIGTGGADVLAGTVGPDAFLLLGGNDRANGLAGADRLCGAAGRDRLRGGTGKDRLDGGPGRDRLDGGAGKDRLIGGKGRDRCLGGKGRDRARGCERRRTIP
jgi:CSLREA domain-containing protein